MTLRKLNDDSWGSPVHQCRAPGHDPPTNMVYEPGTYEWTCSSCGKKTVFTVSGYTLGSDRPGWCYP